MPSFPARCWYKAWDGVEAHATFFAHHYSKKHFEAYVRRYLSRIRKVATAHGDTALCAFVDATEERVVQGLKEALCGRGFARDQASIFCPVNSARLETLVLHTSATLLNLLRHELDGQVGTGGSSTAPDGGCVVEPLSPANAYMAAQGGVVVCLVGEVVRYAFELRRELSAGYSIAVRKMHEYWANRTPPLLGTLSLVIAARLYLDLTMTSESKTDLEKALILFITIFTFLSAFLMVYLRLPHAVDGACQQKCSDVYTNSKGPLSQLVTELISRSRSHNLDFYGNQLDECFTEAGRNITASLADAFPAATQTGFSPPPFVLRTRQKKLRRRRRSSASGSDICSCSASSRPSARSVVERSPHRHHRRNSSTLQPSLEPPRCDGSSSDGSSSAAEDGAHPRKRRSWPQDAAAASDRPDPLALPHHQGYATQGEGLSGDETRWDSGDRTGG
eukprot:Rhum_TRINITY_DN14916_c10_g1::Rhum_TRINITY_DN14916_c10_g1_i2::g.128480::m.128480